MQGILRHSEPTVTLDHYILESEKLQRAAMPKLDRLCTPCAPERFNDMANYLILKDERPDPFDMNTTVKGENRFATVRDPPFSQVREGGDQNEGGRAGNQSSIL